MIHIEKTENGEYRVSSSDIDITCETFGDAIAEAINEHDKGNI